MRHRVRDGQIAWTRIWLHSQLVLCAELWTPRSALKKLTLLAVTLLQLLNFR